MSAIIGGQQGLSSSDLQDDWMNSVKLKGRQPRLLVHKQASHFQYSPPLVKDIKPKGEIPQAPHAHLRTVPNTGERVSIYLCNPKEYDRVKYLRGIYYAMDLLVDYIRLTTAPHC